MTYKEVDIPASSVPRPRCGGDMSPVNGSMAELKAEIARLKALLATQDNSAEVATLQAQIAKLQEELAQATADCAIKTENLNTELNKAKAQVGELTKQLEECRADDQTDTDTINRLTNELTTAQNEIEELKALPKQVVEGVDVRSYGKCDPEESTKLSLNMLLDKSVYGNLATATDLLVGGGEAQIDDIGVAYTNELFTPFYGLGSNCPRHKVMSAQVVQGVSPSTFGVEIELGDNPVKNSYRTPSFNSADVKEVIVRLKKNKENSSNYPLHIIFKRDPSTCQFYVDNIDYRIYTRHECMSEVEPP